MLVITTNTHGRVICRNDNIGTSDRLQLWNENSDRLQRFLAKATFGRELMRRDHPFIYFVEQEQAIEVSLITDSGLASTVELRMGGCMVIQARGRAVNFEVNDPMQVRGK
jgi:hypothetical protein